MKSNKFMCLVITSVIILGAWARTISYGSLLLSVGMSDTQTYIDSSVAANSLQTAFTGRRLLTVNLLYKLMGEETCKLMTSSHPAVGEEGYRAVQPCFNNIVLLQNIISIFGWSLLAWITARHIKSAFHKIGITLIILTFGFTPQIAEWDSILSSESLSVSLFPVFFALTEEFVFRVAAGQKGTSSITFNLLAVCWGFVFFLWLFVRDTHL